MSFYRLISGLDMAEEKITEIKEITRESLEQKSKETNMEDNRKKISKDCRTITKRKTYM